MNDQSRHPGARESRPASPRYGATTLARQRKTRRAVQRKGRRCIPIPGDVQKPAFCGFLGSPMCAGCVGGSVLPPTRDVGASERAVRPPDFRAH